MFQILDEMSELIYVSDLQTYDLLYVNHAGRKLFGIEGAVTGKCYEILQGLDSPCEFCTNCRLKEDSFYSWERTNLMVGRHFLLKDKIIEWGGRKTRVEIAFDMTEQENRRKSVSDALELQNLVTECAKRLYEADENSMAIEDVLRMSGEYLKSDRVYIFEIEGDVMSNTHEWCAPGVEPQIQSLQKISVSLIERWKQLFETQKYVVIDNTEHIREISPGEYDILKSQDIHSVIAVPLLLHGELIGYVGVDNFSVQMKENTTAFLNSVGYFIAAMLRQQRTLAELERLSYYDSLTGIKNRNAYVLSLKKEYRVPVGVVYLDINGMKRINNEFGHKGGDDVLRGTAKIISEIFSEADCYRVGADEFIAICEGIKNRDFLEKVRELRNYFEFHADYKVSLGSVWAKQFNSLREVVFEADRAMCEDKKAFYRGRALSGRYRRQTDDILGITDPETLRGMIKSGQFLVYYQPQVEIETQRVVGAEALVRYRDTSGILYPPGQFIPILEEARLISVLDFYVFECVCAQLRQWMESDIPVVPLAANFSRHTLAEPGFASHLQRICSRYHIDRELVEIEITETVEADNRRLFYHAVEQLNEKKFRISIDDFGVDNANLSLLTEVNFHVLKIDRSVIETVCGNRKTRLLVSALADICHQMGIKIIAEGIETEEQLELLRGMKCDVAQGYLFGRPMPVEEFREQLNSYISQG